MQSEDILQRQLKELSVLHALALATAAVHSEADLLARVTELIYQLLRPAVLGLALVDETQGVIHMHATAYALQGAPQTSVLPLGQGIVGQVIADGQPRRIADVTTEPHYLTGLSTTRSELCVPLKVEERIIGALNVESPMLAAFTADDERLFTTFANQLATALAKVRLRAAERNRLAELEALRATVADLSANLDVPTLLNAILERTQQLLRLEQGRAGIGLYDAHTAEIEMVAGVHSPIGQRVQLGEGVVGYVAETRQPLIVPDYDQWAHPLRSYVSGDWHSALGVPLITRGRFIGVLAAACADAARRFTAADLQLLILFAQPAAIAIDNAHLFEAERQRTQTLEALRQTITDISTNLELATLLEAVLKRAQTLLDSYGGALALYRAETNELEIVAGVSKDIGRRLALGEGLLGHVAQREQPLIIHDYEHWEHRLRSYTSGEWYSAVGVPLMLNRQLMGALTVATVDPARRFTPADMQLLNLFAQQAAIAVENARLFGEVQRLAIIDPLTGQYNRRHFFAEAEREFMRAQRYIRPLSVIMLDIDHFKRVNDTYGHSIGDQVLRVVAQRCRQALRALDILGRYGGEEFSILLLDTSLADAQLVAERLCQQISFTGIPAGRDSLNITVSQGVATLNGASDQLDQLLDHADQALLEAKRTGRNRIVVWQAEGQLHSLQPAQSPPQVHPS